MELFLSLYSLSNLPQGDQIDPVAMSFGIDFDKKKRLLTGNLHLNYH